MKELSVFFVFLSMLEGCLLKHVSAISVNVKCLTGHELHCFIVF